MAGLSSSATRPVVSAVRSGNLRTSIGAAGSSSGATETQTGMARTSAAGTVAGTSSGAAGSSAGMPQLISQFQQMTISPHLVRPVAFLQHDVQPDYLDRAGLVDKPSLDYLGVIDTSLTKVRNCYFVFFFLTQLLSLFWVF